MNLEEKLISLRRELHQHPELSGEEFQTTQKLTAWLKEAGIRILPYDLKTGVVAEIGHGAPVIALRADIDALPIEENSEAVCPSLEKGKMHACGHDFHATVLLGAALLLKQNESRLVGTVRLFFQPAEENYSGALQLIKAGVLKDVDVVFGFHNAPKMPVGEFGTCHGAIMANVDRFEINLAGVGAHAAYPENGTDVIVAASEIINSLQTIVSRNISSHDSAIVSVTRINAGSGWNILPEKAELEGTVRTFDASIRKEIQRRMRDLVYYLAKAMDVGAQFLWHEGPPAVINTPYWSDFSAKIARQFGYVTHNVTPQNGGEDFAHYLHHRPGVFFHIGTGSPQSLHHPGFNIDEKAIFPAAEYYALLAEEALKDLKNTQASA
ncbi:M20 peptidase aminoacylase family protein [Zymomonas mobilis]|uniref:Amidohydrolase n=1 Tax=Zymomonas mobilis subsp. mobilis (strain ATCC 10988 / DSM 424 / LMG 404 / NCIMB 8938 / NRRL B-806 / ZM1) TaxID=555217 RepID=A0A0H3G6E2_ZYMMA|nr:M20 peptidase aminoacylase family protein [Zymomonas mobilis]AEH62700.1 amidohydrolase [Zymomonas mobilis subsp. mobilis ATCC 10988]ART93398.1 amidohydrolase [Zymomonas mobilis subsp. mobilis]MCP9307019.1 M20 peptidase aminoacylase family protein [Zymomonas mobilis]TQL27694.1 amidohydrolase [Zymomonas mobilis]TQL29651.1 amidohydrolase [Zymomonas mobilis]